MWKCETHELIEIEHVAVDAQLVVQIADGDDGGVVNVGHEPGHGIEGGIVDVVEAGEEPGREAEAAVVAGIHAAYRTAGARWRGSPSGSALPPATCSSAEELGER